MTPNKEKLLAALLTSRTKKEAAAAAGISDRTMRSYFEDQEFCQRYREAFAGVVQDATRRAQQLLEPALSTLQTVMEDEEIPAQARVNAAKIALDYAVRLTDQNDLAERLAALEEMRQLITRDKLEQRIAALEMAEKQRRDSMTTTAAVTDYIAPCYLPLHEDIKAEKHRFYNLPGGRGSCKSSFVSLEIVAGVQSDPTGQSNAIVFRRTANTMRDSVFSQIAWAIDMLGTSHLWKATVSPMVYEYRSTGAQILFRGLDDASKLKSIKPRHGVFRYVWFEEFSELPGPRFARNVLQSVVRGQGTRPQIFRSFNPPISLSNWANQFVAEPDGQALTFHTDFTMIPADWLGEAFILEAERLKAVNERAYQHEYLGIATGTGAEVFPTLELREITREEIQQEICKRNADNGKRGGRPRKR